MPIVRFDKRLERQVREVARQEVVRAVAELGAELTSGPLSLAQFASVIERLKEKQQ